MFTEFLAEDFLRDKEQAGCLYAERGGKMWL
jgi:hypothetical protein